MIQEYNPNPPGRVLRKDITFPTGSYTTESKIDLNPWDFAYRSETKQQYYIDLAHLTAEIITGTGGRVAKFTARSIQQIFGDNDDS